MAEPRKRDPLVYTKPIFDEEEINAVLEVLKVGWLGMKDKAKELEGAIATRIGRKHCRLTNSGSSANLLAITALGPPKDAEVITPACTFPTTLNPLLQNGLTPVFIEVTTGFVMDIAKLEEAITPRTRLIVVPHLLGNVADMTELLRIAKERNLMIIEDCCDAFESRWEGKNVGTFGKAGTFSLYASHHFTAAGEGGAVVTDDESYHNRIQMYRDWGRAGDWAWDQSNRFNATLLDGTPFDERYFFRVIGYNLKMTEIQAAFGLAQMKRLDAFRKRRIRNFQTLHRVFQEEFADLFELVTWDKRADPAWFTFPFLVRHDAPFSRNELLAAYTSQGIEGRTLFVGNILLHPAYKDIPHRLGGDLSYSSEIAKRGLFIGIGPHMEESDIAYIAEVTQKFCSKRQANAYSRVAAPQAASKAQRRGSRAVV